MASSGEKKRTKFGMNMPRSKMEGIKKRRSSNIVLLGQMTINQATD